VSRGKRGRRHLPDLSITPEMWEAIRDREQGRREANLVVGTGGGHGAAPAAGRESPPSPGNDQGHRRARPRPLTDDELSRLRSRWVTGIVRPHRLPWVAPELDLADCPCACTQTRACALHAHELGGPRPYAR
jgi:hypothetical protein